jgi:hypothetical protein
MARLVYAICDNLRTQAFQYNVHNCDKERQPIRSHSRHQVLQTSIVKEYIYKVSKKFPLWQAQKNMDDVQNMRESAIPVETGQS